MPLLWNPSAYHIFLDTTIYFLFHFSKYHASSLNENSVDDDDDYSATVTKTKCEKIPHLLEKTTTLK